MKLKVPVRLAGGASANTRTLVEEYLANHPAVKATADSAAALPLAAVAQPPELGLR